MNKIITLIFLNCLFLHGFPVSAQTSFKYDLVIYGATSAGVAAAIQGARMGKSVLLIEPTERLGGLTTGGLGATDIGNKAAIGGISREFYQNIRKHYDQPENWKWQNREDYKDGGQARTEPGEEAMWTFEPSAALQVYQQMLAKEQVEVVYEERLNRQSGVAKAFGSIRMEPVFMVLGQSAAIAASLAIDRGSAVQDVPYQQLKTLLLYYHQRLE